MEVSIQTVTHDAEVFAFGIAVTAASQMKREVTFGSLPSSSSRLQPSRSQGRETCFRVV